jgi:hypothetical protein
MSKRIKYILTCFICILFLLACNTAKIPTEYRFNPKKVKNASTGCWIEVKIPPSNIYISEITLSGELIAIQKDTVFILTEQQLNGIPSAGIKEAVLYIYNNQAGRFVLATVLLFIPNIIAAIANNEVGFLLLDIPWLIGGTIISLNENSSGSHQMKYPKNNILADFSKFARFPQGIPPGLDKNKLHLIHSR